MSMKINPPVTALKFLYEITWSSIWDPFSRLKYITHIMTLVSFYSPWKDQKTYGFLLISGGIKKNSGVKLVKGKGLLKCKV